MTCAVTFGFVSVCRLVGVCAGPAAGYSSGGEAHGSFQKERPMNCAERLIYRALKRSSRGSGPKMEILFNRKAGPRTMKRIGGISKVWAGVAILLTCSGINARAGMITYQNQVTATGTLNGSPFTNALVTVSLTGDTNNVHAGGGVQLFSNAGTITVTIAGLGTATFVGYMFESAFTDLNGGMVTPARCGIGVSGNGYSGSVSDTGSAQCSTYDLKTPITVTGIALPRLNIPFVTDLGPFSMSSFSGTSTFTATVVPEPSSICLMGVGIALFVGFNRARKR
jgi:hypothetical protein